MSVKKNIAIALIVTTIAGIVIKNKFDKFIRQIKSVKVRPTALKNLNLKWNNGRPTVTFTVSFALKNPFNETISIDGLVVKLQRIVLYNQKNNPLFVANPNIKKLKILPFSEHFINNVPFEVDLYLLVGTILDYKNLKMDSFKYELIISVLGTEHIIKQQ